jgi:hypothetical protein
MLLQVMKGGFCESEVGAMENMNWNVFLIIRTNRVNRCSMSFKAVLSGTNGSIPHFYGLILTTSYSTQSLAGSLTLSAKASISKHSSTSSAP